MLCPVGPTPVAQSVTGLVWPVWPANSETAETWFVHSGAPVFALIAAIEPSCWPVVTIPSQKDIAFVVLPYWSCAAGAPPGAFGFGFGPMYCQRILPLVGSRAVMPLLPERNIVPASIGRFLPLPLTTIGTAWIPPL